MEALSDIQQAYQEPQSQREEDLLYMVSWTNNVPEFTPEQVLQRLQDNRSKLKPFLDAAQAKLGELLRAQE